MIFRRKIKVKWSLYVGSQDNYTKFCTFLGKLELSAGEYSYPFAVMLPIKAPSSFEGTYGGISYYAKAKIDIPFTKDKEERTEFTVVNLLDLNLYQHLRVN